jgi:hypothetical protein
MSTCHDAHWTDGKRTSRSGGDDDDDDDDYQGDDTVYESDYGVPRPRSKRVKCEIKSEPAEVLHPNVLVKPELCDAL